MANRPGGINIRTLGDQRREADQTPELYNGNQVGNSEHPDIEVVTLTDMMQLNFEPRKKKDGQDAKDD